MQTRYRSSELRNRGGALIVVISGGYEMKFVKTSFGWRAYALRRNAYVFIGHFYTKREAREALANSGV